MHVVLIFIIFDQLPTRSFDILKKLYPRLLFLRTGADEAFKSSQKKSVILENNQNELFDPQNRC